jgi:error-prone DNA polymerase
MAAASHGARTLVGGLVTHRQRPHTAGGTVFLSLEDETGLVNVICPPWVWQRHRRVARTVPAVLVRGRLEREGLVINLIAETIEPLTAPGAALAKSRDFR